MNNLVNYIYAILMFIILTIILEMLLPDGDSKKYVKLVSGFLLTFMVISPVVSILTGGIDIKDAISDAVYGLDFSYESTMPVFNQQVYIDNLFVEGIKNDVSNIVEEVGYIINEIDVKYEKNEKNQYSQITKVSFKIVSKVNKEENNINEIKKVNINSNDNVTEPINDKYNISEEEKNNIIDKISSRYEMNKSDVNIL